ncbi:MAG: flagellar brake protein [Psychrosphaera sp.]|nr:flagellar brake protein [Psychrosphaera sp.]
MIITEQAKPAPAKPHSYFELLPGKPVDLQINQPTLVRAKLKLLGYETGKFVMLKYPEGRVDKAITDVLIEGAIVIVRYILEGDKGECCAFRAVVKHISEAPGKYIYLTYPVHIENRQLRLHQRVSVHIPAQITVGTTKIQGIVNDVSENGCGFVFKAKNDQVNVKKCHLTVTISSPGGEPVEIPAEVCNSRNERKKVSVGIKFTDATEQVEALMEQLFIHTDIM